MARSQQVPEAPPALRRGLLETTLTVSMLVGMVTIGLLGALGPFITRDLEMSLGRFGSLATVMFVTAAVVSPALGDLVDRFDAKRMLAGLFVIIAIGLAVMSVAISFALLLASTCIAGLGLATANPTTNQVIAERIPRPGHGRSMGLAYTGPQLALLFSGLVLPVVATHVGWRGAVLVTAAASATGVFAVWRWVPDVQRHTAAAAKPEMSDRVALAREHRWLVVFAFMMGFGTTAVPAHLPLFAVNELGMTPQVAGWTLVLIGSLAIPGRLAWTQAASRRGDSLPALLWGSVGSVTGQLGLVVASLGATPFVWLGGAVLGLTAMAWMPLAMLAVVNLAEPQRAGRAAGIVQRATFVGCATGPLVVGLLTDWTGTYLFAWLAVTGIYILAVVTLVTARSRRRHTVAITSRANDGSSTTNDPSG